MKKIIVTQPFLNICSMQVCAIKKVTDKEILEVCNTENPSGTRAGWTTVVREIEKESMFRTKKHLPVQCQKYPNRLHFIALC